MRAQKLLLLMLVGLFGLSVLGQGYAQEQLIEEEMTKPSFEKIYLSPDRILIYPEGIFYLNEAGDVVPARLVASDASGLYAVAATYRCPGCGWRNSDNRCINRKCPLYGK
ncbi:MAG: hypothetical protein S4CHLAM123_01380 [Chlamydiales bacterium]|nr:hypothetical protein [Chlamydiales bacterium]